MGCASTSDNGSSSSSRKLNQADIDLIVERAKAEERARINRELMYQAKQKRVFDDILARQYTQTTLADKSKKTNVSQPIQALDHQKQIKKIIPENRQPVLYKKLNGVEYFRCAANSLTPVTTEKGLVTYSTDKLELSATLCKSSRDKSTILKLQNSLYKLGYLKSDTLTKDQLIDGIWGETTLVAVKEYQQDKGLLLGQLTIETLEHIGVFDVQTAPLDMLGVNEIQLVKVATEEKAEPKSETTAETAAINQVGMAETTDELPKVEGSEEKPGQSEVQKPAVIAVHDQVEPVEQLASAADTHGSAIISAPEVAKQAVVIEKIIPTSRKLVLYKELEGVRYFRCAANALTPNEIKPGVWTYEKTKTELSATLCKMSRDVATMTALQYELYSKGYLKSDTLTQDQLIDGVWGESTLMALKEYQQQNGLLFGQLTIESLEHLGVFSADPMRIKPANSVVVHSQTASETATPVDKDILPLAQSGHKVAEKMVEKMDVHQTAGETMPVVDNGDIAKTIKLVRVPGDTFKVTDAVDTAKYLVYGTVDGNKVWRCRARSEVPQTSENGENVYNGVMEFRATLCKVSRSAEIIKALQLALKEKGYLKPSPPLDLVVVDGVWGINTLDAVKAYQKANGLAYGQLTLEVFEHLGVFEKE
ncbi:peptidoglycan-binding domain-containing protein [Thiomicrorhabdus immobilis]|nr:peptidoglycan-binding domain-containing protein [Thiomicrorhabdus immobilis]